MCNYINSLRNLNEKSTSAKKALLMMVMMVMTSQSRALLCPISSHIYVFDNN